MSETNGKSLTLEQILSAQDYEIRRVETPEWGGHVYVRTVSANSRDKFEMSFQSGDYVGLRARLVGLSLCDADGNFLQPTDAQVNALGSRSARAVDRVFEVCQEISGLTDADVEVMEKNSVTEAAKPSG